MKNIIKLILVSSLLCGQTFFGAGAPGQMPELTETVDTITFDYNGFKARLRQKKYPLANMRLQAIEEYLTQKNFSDKMLKNIESMIPADEFTSLIGKPTQADFFKKSSNFVEQLKAGTANLPPKLQAPAVIITPTTAFRGGVPMPQPPVSACPTITSTPKNPSVGLCETPPAIRTEVRPAQPLKAKAPKPLFFCKPDLPKTLQEYENFLDTMAVGYNAIWVQQNPAFHETEFSAELSNLFDKNYDKFLEIFENYKNLGDWNDQNKLNWKLLSALENFLGKTLANHVIPKNLTKIVSDLTPAAQTRFMNFVRTIASSTALSRGSLKKILINWLTKTENAVRIPVVSSAQEAKKVLKKLTSNSVDNFSGANACKFYSDEVLKDSFVELLNGLEPVLFFVQNVLKAFPNEDFKIEIVQLALVMNNIPTNLLTSDQQNILKQMKDSLQTAVTEYIDQQAKTTAAQPAAVQAQREDSEIIKLQKYRNFFKKITAEMLAIYMPNLFAARAETNKKLIDQFNKKSTEVVRMIEEAAQEKVDAVKTIKQKAIIDYLRAFLSSINLDAKDQIVELFKTLLFSLQPVYQNYFIETIINPLWNSTNIWKDLAPAVIEELKKAREQRIAELRARLGEVTGKKK